VHISNSGTLGDANKIRIGQPGTHTTTHVAGIAAVTPPGVPEVVVIDPVTHQMGSQALDKQPISSFVIADTSFPELATFPVPLTPGVNDDMTIEAGGYLLITEPGLYEFCFTNHAVNTGVQQIRLVFVPDATPLDPPINFDSSLGNHTLVGIADNRNHTFSKFAITAATRMTVEAYAGAINPLANCEMNNTSMVVNCLFRRA